MEYFNSIFFHTSGPANEHHTYQLISQSIKLHYLLSVHLIYLGQFNLEDYDGQVCCQMEGTALSQFYQANLQETDL
jgi:hypothetical protein